LFNFFTPRTSCAELLHVTNVLDQIEDDEVNETRSSHWKTRNVRGVVIGKSRTKLLRERFRRSWGGIILNRIKKIRVESVGLIQLSQDRIH
jgi:hypothetical protein